VNYEKPKEIKKIHILFWRSVMSDRNWGSQGLTTFTEKNCVFTHDQQLLKGVHEFDAVIFNAFKKNQGEPFKVLPANRSERQLYILYARE
jgi:hypothetical protein